MFVTTPSSILTNSTKLASAVDDNESFAKVKSILNLWAPVAFSFEEPWALSSKLESSVEVTKVSDIVRPIL